MLVSIGIPTYNRATGLAVALESAREQTHSHLEIIISDNASDDGTEALCRDVAYQDRRVRYVRQERNLGPTANFNWLFAACQGEYVMMLADDDWLDLDYVAGCLRVLETSPGTALVAGWAHYHEHGRDAGFGALHQHLERNPGARVQAYLATVDDNGIFYGVMPRRVLQLARPLPNLLGNDWLLLARIACQGPIRTVEDVQIHRELGGTSVDIESILALFEVSSWQQRAPQLVIAAHLLRDIMWGHDAYRRLGRLRRVAVAFGGAVASIRWPDLAWHLVTPSMTRLARRRRGRPLWELYLRVTRALGAGSVR